MLGEARTPPGRLLQTAAVAGIAVLAASAAQATPLAGVAVALAVAGGLASAWSP